MQKYFEGDIINGFELVDRFIENNHYKGLFICKHCGKWWETSIGAIVNGTTQSCGCRWNVTHGLSKHKVYWVWFGMKQRCLNPNNISYKHYGAKGIQVYKSWVKDVKSFFDYVTNLPSYPGEEYLGKGKDKLTLDRVNPDGNYEPGNLRWATPTQQTMNTSVK